MPPIGALLNPSSSAAARLALRSRSASPSTRTSWSPRPCERLPCTYVQTEDMSMGWSWVTTQQPRSNRCRTIDGLYSTHSVV
ncbi:hypothetical protein PsYK624_054580 [Phanerochaete sordida]|uniref:Uncharacterized protein n=1 Tax=Phanerochaete sordida TaxID=48140 RepID=A0A9P3G8J1_9APHY|nr:hypothetical protein PsYK624_054580 [Phanerochaete sordida]